MEITSDDVELTTDDVELTTPEPIPEALALLKTLVCPADGKRLRKERLAPFNNPVGAFGHGRVVCICGFSKDYFYTSQRQLTKEEFRNLCDDRKGRPPSTVHGCHLIMREFQCAVCEKIVKQKCDPKKKICSDRCAEINRVRNYIKKQRARGLRISAKYMNEKDPFLRRFWGLDSNQGG